LGVPEIKGKSRKVGVIVAARDKEYEISGRGSLQKKPSLVFFFFLFASIYNEAITD
jgi:hypothetical protein